MRPILCELGTTLALIASEHREAFQYLRAAVRIAPDMQVAYLNLGLRCSTSKVTTKTRSR